MGFLKRTGNLIRGFFEKIIGKIEENNSDLLLEDVKNKIEKARKNAEKSIIEIQTNAELARLEIKKHEQILEGISVKITMATAKKDKELLTDLFILEEEEKLTLERARETHKEAVENALRIRDEYKIFESEMKSRLEEIRTLKSKSKIAGIKESVYKLDDTYSHAKDFYVAENIINKKKAQADAREILKMDSTEFKIRKMEHDNVKERAQARAELVLCDNEGMVIEAKA